MDILRVGWKEESNMTLRFGAWPIRRITNLLKLQMQRTRFGGDSQEFGFGPANFEIFIRHLKANR